MIETKPARKAGPFKPNPRVAWSLIDNVIGSLPDDAKVYVRGDAEYPLSCVRAGDLKALLAAAKV